MNTKETQDVIAYLKENLKIEINYYVPLTGNDMIMVSLRLGDEIISEDNLELPDTD